MSAPRPVRLLRGFATVGGWTMASRVLGFARDVLIAALLGAGPAADAFFVAFRLPNLFRRFFAEGAFNMAFVPLFAKRLEGEGPQSARGFAQEALAGLVAVLLGLSVIALLIMPLLVLALAAGFADDPARFDLAVLYARIQFPYLFCMSLTALFSGVLTALGRFGPPAAAPVLLNVILISAMALAAWMAAPVGLALSWGVFTAGFAQAAMLMIAARRAGMGLRLVRPRLSPAMRRLVRLGIPGAISGGVTQLNLVIGTAIASFFAGAVAWLGYADRLYQLPLGVIGIAIGVVLLPELSRRVRAGDQAGGREALNRAAEFALLLSLPAAAGLAAAAGPVVEALFQRGAFAAEDTAATAAAAAIYSLGLPSFVLLKVIQPAFFAREKMRPPLNYAIVSMIANTLVSLAGAPMIGFLAIPIGTTVAGWLNLALHLRGARAFGEEARADARLLRKLPPMAISALLCGLSAWAAASALSEAHALLRLGGLLAAGGGVYVAAAFSLGAVSMRDLRAALRRSGA